MEAELEDDPRRARRRARVTATRCRTSRTSAPTSTSSPTTTSWKTYFFYGYGFRSDANCARCPETTRLIEAIPGMETAMFSILAPGSASRRTTGRTRACCATTWDWSCPTGPVERVGIRVGDETRGWSEGGSLVFDDTYEHEAWNETDGHPGGALPRRRAAAAPADARPNAAVIKAIGWSPFIQDAKRRHQRVGGAVPGPARGRLTGTNLSGGLRSRRAIRRSSSSSPRTCSLALGVLTASPAVSARRSRRPSRSPRPPSRRPPRVRREVEGAVERGRR